MRLLSSALFSPRLAFCLIFRSAADWTLGLFGQMPECKVHLQGKLFGLKELLSLTNSFS